MILQESKVALMGKRKYTDIVINGVTYADVDVAAAALSVHPVSIRQHIRNGTLHRACRGLSGSDPMPVRVRGNLFDRPAQAAAHYDVCIDHVYRHIAAGAPDRIGLDNERGQYRAKAVTIGPVSFRSRAEASRKLGLGKDYVSRAMTRNSKRMLETVIAAAMRYAETEGTVS
ncbi:hypothetical protein RCCS2_17636 [Roseobacter sp. CCS2]|nr:hypothetical protein RCCS2_17636 [Roseobacter sp. CCS2]